MTSHTCGSEGLELKEVHVTSVEYGLDRILNANVAIE